MQHHHTASFHGTGTSAQLTDKVKSDINFLTKNLTCYYARTDPRDVFSAILLGFWGRTGLERGAFPGRGGLGRGLGEVDFGSEREARPPGALALNAGFA